MKRTCCEANQCDRIYDRSLVVASLWIRDLAGNCSAADGMAMNRLTERRYLRACN